MATNEGPPLARQTAVTTGGDMAARTRVGSRFSVIVSAAVAVLAAAGCASSGGVPTQQQGRAAPAGPEVAQAAAAPRGWGLGDECYGSPYLLLDNPAHVSGQVYAGYPRYANYVADFSANTSRINLKDVLPPPAEGQPWHLGLFTARVNRPELRDSVTPDGKIVKLRPPPVPVVSVRVGCDGGE